MTLITLHAEQILQHFFYCSQLTNCGHIFLVKINLVKHLWCWITCWLLINARETSKLLILTNVCLTFQWGSKPFIKIFKYHSCFVVVVIPDMSVNTFHSGNRFWICLWFSMQFFCHSFDYLIVLQFTFLHKSTEERKFWKFECLFFYKLINVNIR